MKIKRTYQVRVYLIFCALDHAAAEAVDPVV